MTPPTESPETETLRQVAERIVRETILVVPGRIADKYADAIEAALRNERERCAIVAETHSATDCDGPDCGVVIARAIREGK